MTHLRRRGLSVMSALGAVLAVTLALPATRASDMFELRLVATDAAGGGDATIAPDGSRFLASSSRSGNVDLWMYDLRRGKWIQLTDEAADEFEGRWSPDARHIAYTSTRSGNKDVWVLDVDTRRAIRLTDSADEEEYPVWSPDGKWVAYTGGPWNGRDFYLVPAAGGPKHKLTRTSGQAGACSFEPTGESLVCHRYDAGRGQVVRLWLDGQETPLTGGSSWDYKPAASPDGQTIAFSRSIEGPSQIWTIATGSGRATQLVRSPHDDRWPTWDAAGRQLLFHRLVDEGTGVFLLDRASGQRRQLVDGGEHPRQASIDAGLRMVAYCAQTHTGLEVRLRDLQAGTVRSIPTGGREACFPRWSPDGETLALTLRGATRWEIATAKRDGSNLRVLTEAHRELRGLDGVIDWSPDGRRLVFQADTAPFEAQLFTIDRESRELQAVTGPGFFDESPSWTRDGGIVFMSTRGGNWTWSLMKWLPGSAALTTLAGPDWVEKNFPRMSGAGRLLWSSRDARGVERVIERNGTAAEQSVEAAGSGARWPSYAGEDRWLLWTATQRRVEYWIVRNPGGMGSPLQTAITLVPPVVEAERVGAAACASPTDLHRR